MDSKNVRINQSVLVVAHIVFLLRNILLGLCCPTTSAGFPGSLQFPPNRSKIATKLYY